MQLPASVDPVILRMQPDDLRDEQVVAQLPRRRRATDRGAVAARGEAPLNCRAQHPADELDPQTIPVPVDEPDHPGPGRSSPFANNPPPPFRISLHFSSLAPP